MPWPLWAGVLWEESLRHARRYSSGDTTRYADDPRSKCLLEKRANAIVFLGRRSCRSLSPASAWLSVLQVSITTSWNQVRAASVRRRLWVSTESMNDSIGNGGGRWTRPNFSPCSSAIRLGSIEIMSAPAISISCSAPAQTASPSASKSRLTARCRSRRRY